MAAMGRPKKPDSDKKSRTTKLYFTADTWARIQKLAKAEDFDGRESEWLAWKIRRLLREMEEGR